MKLPKKKDYRPRAHANPYGDVNIYIPSNPGEIDWKTHFINGKSPDFLDIGCGYGRFLMEIAKENEGNNICGMEIRKAVSEYVDKKITCYRENQNVCLNCSVITTNAFLFLPNFFPKSSLQKIFILFPDPMFKKRKQKARIVSDRTNAMYAFLLKPNGRLYISTDVKELFDTMIDSLDNTTTLRRLGEEECLEDGYFEKTYTLTDESTRAAIKTGSTFAAIFEKYN